MSDRVRFVHAADVHLDAPFHGIRAEDGAVGRVLAEATFNAFERVVSVCLEREVDFLVLAGDTYDTADVSLRAQLAFRRGMQRLAEGGVEVFLAHGNHDPASGWSAKLALPDSVRVFSAGRVERFEVVRHGRVVAAVYGRSFGKSAETANLSLGYSREGAEPVAVGVLHANVGGRTEYDPYAPASLDDLRAARMDYWALGHIHKHEVLSREPWIVYAGSPQGLNPKEIGAHGCVVVEVGPGGSVNVEHVETAPVAWSRLTVDVSNAGGIEDVRAAVAEACHGARRESGRPTVARVRLEGRGGAHADLVRPGVVNDLVEDLRSELGSGQVWLWLDRLDDASGSAIDLDALRGGADFSAELVRIADELAGETEELDGLLGEIVAPVATSLGGYQLGLEPKEALERARDAALDLLLAEGGDAR